MNFKDLREANLSKAQINKVHDKADEMPKSDFIKRYGKNGDAVRFATATNQVKKELGLEAYTSGPGTSQGRQGDGRYSPYYDLKAIPVTLPTAAELGPRPRKPKSWFQKIFSDLDKEDEKSVGRVVKGLKKAVKAHQGQVDALTKDIKDETELDEFIAPLAKVVGKAAVPVAKVAGKTALAVGKVGGKLAYKGAKLAVKKGTPIVKKVGKEVGKAALEIGVDVAKAGGKAGLSLAKKAGKAAVKTALNPTGERSGSPKQDRADGMSDADLRKKYGKHIIKKEEVVDEANNPHQDVNNKSNSLSPGENKDINKQRQNQLNKKSAKAAALVKKFAQIERGRKATALADPIKYKMDGDNSASKMPYTHYRSKAGSYAANVKPEYYFKKEEVEITEGGPGSGPQKSYKTIPKNETESEKDIRQDKAIAVMKQANDKRISNAFKKMQKQDEKQKKKDKADTQRLLDRQKRQGLQKIGRRNEEVEITEAVSAALVNQIKRMTDRNNHFGVRIELARIAGDKELMQHYASLEKMHSKLGGVIGDSALVVRQKLESVLKNRLQRKFNDKDADRLMDAL